MAIDDQEVAQRLEVLQLRDGELGRIAESVANTYRAGLNHVVTPYAFTYVPPFEDFYESFIYVDPHLKSGSTRQQVTVLNHDGFIVFIPKHCLISSTLSEVLQEMGDADFAYGDSFHFDPADPSQFTHQLRPGWSPERLRGHCYVGDVVAASKKLVKRAGGKKFLAKLTSHDRALRLAELATSHIHLSELLYGSPIETRVPAVDVDAVRSHCVRAGIAAEVTLVGNGDAVKVVRHRNQQPSICAIMPTRGTSADVFGERVVLAAHAIQKLRERSTCSDIEMVLIADSDTPDATLDEIKNIENVQVVMYDKPFNFAEKTNIGALQTEADYLLFMNDDVEIISPEIIEIMLSYFEDPTVGMVGPMLKYEDGTIQSAGHLLNPIPYDLYRGAEKRSDAAFGILNVAREVSSVIAAFSLTRRAVFEEVGGLSHLFPSDYNDIDFAFKLDMMGYRTIFTPFAECFHFESKTRTPEENPESVAFLGKRWQHKVEADRYGNRCLQLYQTVWKSNHDSEWSLREAMGADTVTP